MLGSRNACSGDIDHCSASGAYNYATAREGVCECVLNILLQVKAARDPLHEVRQLSELASTLALEAAQHVDRDELDVALVEMQGADRAVVSIGEVKRV